MDREIELHDSNLMSISMEGMDCVAQLCPAIIHELSDEPHRVFTQNVDFIFRNARITQCPENLPMWISDGTLSVNEKLHENLVSLSLEATGEVRFFGVTQEGEQFRIEASQVTAVIRGDAVFLEYF